LFVCLFVCLFVSKFTHKNEMHTIFIGSLWVTEFT
jgi:hypothetical protein